MKKHHFPRTSVLNLFNETFIIFLETLSYFTPGGPVKSTHRNYENKDHNWVSWISTGTSNWCWILDNTKVPGLNIWARFWYELLLFFPTADTCFFVLSLCYQVRQVVPPAGAPGHLCVRHRHKKIRVPGQPQEGGRTKGNNFQLVNLRRGRKQGQPFYRPRLCGRLYLSTFEGEFYFLCEEDDQGASGLAPGCMHGAPHDCLDGTPGRNTDDARHHQHDPSMHRDVTEGAAAGGEGGHAHPGQLPHDGRHKGHVIIW